MTSHAQSPVDAARASFSERYGDAGSVRTFYAPGRVNLIGEHTDYNDGFVLPLAIDRGVAIAARARTDRMVSIASVELGEDARIDLDCLGPPRTGTWLDYVRGVVAMLEERGVRTRGADVVVASDLPSGAGLSSSAALEVGVGFALAHLAEAPIERVALALACQAAEHAWVGTSCGIMDQLVVALGREGHALLIDCRSLAPTFVPLDGDRAQIVICDSKVKHELASSAYNERRAECERAVSLLAPELPGVRALRDVSPVELEASIGRLFPPVDRRARHVVSENERTLSVASLLADGDLARVGEHLYASHRSLRDDYEVSSEELDVLVELAREVPGVYGARMTGGGFGGCTVNLVANEAVPAFERSLREGFARRFGTEPDVFVTRACEGVRELGGVRAEGAARPRATEGK